LQELGPMDEKYKLIHSPLTRSLTRDGITIKIQIYHGADDAKWLLEVVDHEGGSTVWDETFETDKAALEEVLLTIENEGIETFLVDL
jgi:uncharacterized protein